MSDLMYKFNAIIINIKHKKMIKFDNVDLLKCW